MGLIYTVTNRNFSLFRGLFTTLFGLALLIWPQQFPQLIVRIIAGFSLLAGLFTLITLAERVKRTGERGIVSTLKHFLFSQNLSILHLLLHLSRLLH